MNIKCCGIRMKRLTRDWTHANPLPTNPPAHVWRCAECGKERKQRIRLPKKEGK